MLPSDPSEVEAQLWKDFQGRLAYDVGSHLGQSLLHMVDRFKQIEAFEPSTEAFAALALDWIDNPWVHLHRLAVADHDGTLDMSVREICIESGQLAAMDMPYTDFVKGVSSPQEDALPWGKEIGVRTVLCRSVDSLVDSLGIPDFIKADTEGSEVQILNGATELLRIGRTSWLIEFHSEPNYDQCVKILKEADYTVETVRHPHYKPESHLWKSHGWIRATSVIA